MRLYIIYDNKTDEHVGHIIQAKSDPAALRYFTDAAKDNQSFISKHLADFDLVCIGDLDGCSVKPYNVTVQSGASLEALLNAKPEDYKHA